MAIVYLIVGVLCGIAGYQSCERKGHDVWLGAALGFFLGLIGLLVVATFRDRRKAVAPVQTYAPAVARPSLPSAAPGGQRYVAPIVPQYIAPHPPAQPVQAQAQPPAGPLPS